MRQHLGISQDVVDVLDVDSSKIHRVTCSNGMVWPRSICPWNCNATLKAELLSNLIIKGDFGTSDVEKCLDLGFQGQEIFKSSHWIDYHVIKYIHCYHCYPSNNQQIQLYMIQCQLYIIYIYTINILKYAWNDFQKTMFQKPGPPFGWYVRALSLFPFGFTAEACSHHTGCAWHLLNPWRRQAPLK